MQERSDSCTGKYCSSERPAHVAAYNPFSERNSSLNKMPKIFHAVNETVLLKRIQDRVPMKTPCPVFFSYVILLLPAFNFNWHPAPIISSLHQDHPDLRPSDTIPPLSHRAAPLPGHIYSHIYKCSSDYFPPGSPFPGQGPIFSAH